MRRYYSNGKLLLTAEYVVLNGATALALPTKFGQALEVTPRQDQRILWKSRDEKAKIWFEEEFKLMEGTVHSMSSEPSEVSQRLSHILTEAHKANPAVFSKEKGYDIKAGLNFNRTWGLGSSSTLINNLAKWFQIDAYGLLNKTFGGSGYDIAAAQNEFPVLYDLQEGRPKVLTTTFNPTFKQHLFFVYLNRKQNSRQAIENYRKQPTDQLEESLEKITVLTHQILECKQLEEFELLLEIHETLISKLIRTPKIKSSLFPDYPRMIKSLGAWGGDFVLATGRNEEMQYFREKGFHTIIPYSDMIL